MELQGKHLKFKDNKTKGSLEAPQYTLTYRQTRDLDESSRTSHAILSALAAGDAILLELNSSLFYTPDKPTDELIYQYIDKIKSLGLAYRYRKVPPSGSPSFLEKLVKGPRGDAHQLIVLKPHDFWKSENILSLILPYGVKYYMTGDPSTDTDLLDSVTNMTDKEKLECFRMIVFDMGLLGHMGIYTASVEPGEIKNLLKIQC